MTAYEKLLGSIRENSKTKEFKKNTEILIGVINSFSKNDFINIVENIGTIPESIRASSSEEKLYSKASDIVLSRCFSELGLESHVLSERANSADITAKSRFHRYTLVADAKAFRMSRTAKNQKDFKIDNLSNWRGSEIHYALLCSPYFQYPKKSSQIYAQAIDKGVSLLSWEHMLFMLNNGLIETSTLNLESIWNSSVMLARDPRINRESNFFSFINERVCEKIGCDSCEFVRSLEEYKSNMVFRGNGEREFYLIEIETIKNYSREQAIQELIKFSKYKENINTINKFTKELG